MGFGVLRSRKREVLLHKQHMFTNAHYMERGYLYTMYRMQHYLIVLPVCPSYTFCMYLASMINISLISRVRPLAPAALAAFLYCH